MPSDSITHEIQTISDYLHNEAIRYSRKGLNVLPALLVSIFFLLIIPALLQPIYLLLPHNNLFIMHSVISTSCHLFSLIFANMLLNELYKGRFPYFQQFKISQEPWPWQNDPNSYRIFQNRVFRNVFLNSGIILFLINFSLAYGDMVELTIDPLKFPSTLEIICHLYFFTITEDFSFYWAHRLVHTPFLYRTIHKQHHEYNTTTGLATTYAHPLEFIFIDLLPASVGMAILGKRVHIFTQYMWCVYRVIESVDGHCGFDFPWSPFRLMPFSTPTGYHAYHHSHNIGNYESFFNIWDTLFGTNVSYYKYVKKLEEKKNKTN